MTETNMPLYVLFMVNTWSNNWINEADSEDLADIVRILEEIVEEDDDFDINSVKVVKICDEGVFQLNCIITPPTKGKVEIIVMFNNDVVED